MATSSEELTHWKGLWCWEGLEAGGEGDDRGWDGWMASQTRWTWVWVNSGSWWWTGRPGVLRFMGSQRIGHDWATELNWISSSVMKSSTCIVKWHFYQYFSYILSLYTICALSYLLNILLFSISLFYVTRFDSFVFIVSANHIGTKYINLALSFKFA